MESEKENDTDRLFSESVRNIAENIVDTRMDAKSTNGKVTYIENRLDLLSENFAVFEGRIYILILIQIIMLIILIVKAL